MPSITMMPTRARTLSALGALEERNGSMELYVAGGKRRQIPHCYSTICSWIRKILRGMWRAGGGDGGAGNGELAGLAWAAICESGAVRH